MHLTDKQIQQIITNNCGTPLEPEKVKYHIWLNKWKLDFNTKSPFYRDNEKNRQALDSYRRLIKAGEEILKTL